MNTTALWIASAVLVLGLLVEVWRFAKRVSRLESDRTIHACELDRLNSLVQSDIPEQAGPTETPLLEVPGLARVLLLLRSELTPEQYAHMAEAGMPKEAVDAILDHACHLQVPTMPHPSFLQTSRRPARSTPLGRQLVVLPRPSVARCCDNCAFAVELPDEDAPQPLCWWSDIAHDADSDKTPNPLDRGRLCECWQQEQAECKG